MTQLDTNALVAVAVDALDDIKAQDIRVFDTSKKTSAFERIIVATATSGRQTRAMAIHVGQRVKAEGGAVNGMEGTESGEWVLIDLGAVVVHCMQPNIRSYYNLEELWGSSPVDVKALIARKAGPVVALGQEPAA
ncbi:MAG: ribosome silencing factor [Duodenibacillus sp.]|nr:ribosome silencing factor [Duodenibacillus sp.]